MEWPRELRGGASGKYKDEGGGMKEEQRRQLNETGTASLTGDPAND